MTFYNQDFHQFIHSQNTQVHFIQPQHYQQQHNNNDNAHTNIDDFDTMLENMNNLDIPETSTSISTSTSTSTSTAIPLTNNYYHHHNNYNDTIIPTSILPSPSPSPSLPLRDDTMVCTKPKMVRKVSSDDGLNIIIIDQQSNTTRHDHMTHHGTISDIADDALQRFTAPSFHFQNDHHHKCEEHEDLEPISLPTIPRRVVSCSDESTSSSTASTASTASTTTTIPQGAEMSSNDNEEDDDDVSFVPSNYHVICDKGKKHYNHIGNRRFRVTLEIFLGEYKKAKSKAQKGVVLTNVVDLVRKNGGGFVRQDKNDGQWYDVGDHLAREKAGEYFRALMLNSNTNSCKRKRSVVVQHDDDGDNLCVESLKCRRK